MLLADVIVPLHVDGVFTYSVPPDLEETLQTGSCVIVQFGKKKFYSAVVDRIYQSNAETEALSCKQIAALWEQDPLALETQIRFWRWIAYYYLCPLGDVLKAALPAALKIESETLVFRNPEYVNYPPLTPAEERIFWAIHPDKGSSIAYLQKQLDSVVAPRQIKSLAEKEAIFLHENIQEASSARLKTMVTWASPPDNFNWEAVNESLKRAKKQQQLLDYFLQTAGNSTAGIASFSMERGRLAVESGFNTAIINSLVEKNILKYVTSEPMSDHTVPYAPQHIKPLSDAQRTALNAIHGAFERKKTALLHGVTSSGKTEIYIHLINEAVEAGRQALYLLPEIALTAQIAERLRFVFGDRLAIFHSRLSDSQRARLWKRMLSDSPPQVILGARSAVFLPFTSLQLVVVDEESETSYKQQEPAPRYNGRDAAVYLATLHGANTLLGSATPSIESYYNALKGKYVLVELATRYADIALPEIETVDTAYLRRVRLMRNTLSPALQKEMETALKAHEQVILFRNRRGFAPFTYCPNCGWSPRCPHCDVPLSYHKHNHRLQCHYCGAVSMPKEVCPDCNTDSLRQSGAGTERIEEDVKLCFPHAKIIRMDTDTTRGRHSFEKMLSDFSQHKADILLGTQMVAKGLDFDNVSACGIIDADQMLNNPDFRAYERAFQMLTQVSGRAGRKNRQGKVLVQTAQPDNPVLSFVKQNNYSAFFETVAAERRIFGYPPFSRLIAVYLQHSKDETVQDASVAAANYLRNQLGEKYVLGPSRPATVRIHNLFVQKILLKITPKTGGDAARQALKDCRTFLKNKEDCRSVWVYFDADPV